MSTEDERFKLLYGPYEPPRIPRNQRMFSEREGYVKVIDYFNGRIPWPQVHKRESLVLCGDLVRAVQKEPVLGIEAALEFACFDTWLLYRLGSPFY